MPPRFASGTGYATRDQALRFEMTRSGADFVETAVHATPAGEQRTPARIDLVYGSGGSADEIYFTWHGDRLNELPIVWLHPLGRWGEQPFDPHNSGDFSRMTTPRCLECHNTWFTHVPGTENEYKRDHFILGVTCERCHGPGREHVTYHQTHPSADPPQAIVHPGRLPRERQLDLCGQCHHGAARRRGPAFAYRPGEPLEAYFRVNRNKHQEEDRVADQVKYLRQSKCFQRNDTLTCTTCHNPHKPSPGLNKMQGACLKCHEASDCAEQKRLPAGVRGDCVGCHMPRFTRIQVFFHTEDDQYVPAIRPHQHRIGIYPAARQEVLLEYHRKQSSPESRQEAERLGKVLIEHCLGQADAFRKEYRFMAAIGAAREAVRLDPAPATRAKLQEVVAIQAAIDADWYEAVHQMNESRFAEAIETLKRILAVKPDLAKAHGKLGTCYAIAGQDAAAVKHLQAVAQCDPDDAYGYTMLAWLAYLGGRPDEAVESYRRADEIEPYTAKINFQWGLALAKLGRMAEAIKHYRLAVTIDPRDAGGYQALSQALRQEGQPAEALHFARRAARLTQFRDPDILLALAASYLDLGRTDEANDMVVRALDAARTSSPDIRARIEARADALRAR
jgi:tetratricopeptide (TPR) repeat protein